MKDKMSKEKQWKQMAGEYELSGSYDEEDIRTIYKGVLSFNISKKAVYETLGISEDELKLGDMFEGKNGDNFEFLRLWGKKALIYHNNSSERLYNNTYDMNDWSVVPSEQKSLLLGKTKIYLPEWHQTTFMLEIHSINDFIRIITQYPELMKYITNGLEKRYGIDKPPKRGSQLTPNEDELANLLEDILKTR